MKIYNLQAHRINANVVATDCNARLPARMNSSDKNDIAGRHMIKLLSCHCSIPQEEGKAVLFIKIPSCFLQFSRPFFNVILF